MSASLPSGTVTFVFTDIEGSTRLFQRFGDAYRGLLADHNRILRAAFTASGGVEVKTEGDAFFVAFGSATDAVTACLEAQRGLAAHAWPKDGVVRVRIGIHTGEATPIGHDYVALVVHEAARVASAGHGGQTVVSEATAAVTATLPKGSRLSDLGEHRLKDLHRPLRLYQLDHDDLPGRFPPIRSLDTAAHNLPAQIASFVGRRDQIDELVGHVQRERLVTLVGAGGAGKTRLALEVAGRFTGDIPDGIWLVELAASAGDGIVSIAVGQAVSAPRPVGQDPDVALMDFLRMKSLLLVLDNCEHLLNQCAGFVEALLRSSPRVRVLATSRESLGVPGEMTWRVPSLDIGLTGEAVELFVERARLTRPGFELSDDDREVAARICKRLDGLPLAVELAAARCRAMTVPEIADRLDDRFRLLTGGARRELGRQQTLRATVDWSYDLLDEADRVLLRRLSVFIGGCTLEMAEQVCAGDPLDEIDVLDGLTRLVDKSLIIAGEVDGVARYRMLETVRDYASDKLMLAEEAPAARAAHLACLVGIASRAAPGLITGDERFWLPRLDVELENIRAALAWAGETNRIGMLRLSGDLGVYWWARGLLAEGRRWIESGLVAGGSEGSVVEGRAHGAASFLALLTSDLDVTREHSNATLSIDEALGHPNELDFAVSWATLDLAATVESDDPEQSAVLVSRAIERAERSGQVYAIGRAHQHLAHLALQAGDLDAALAYCDRAVEMTRSIDTRLGANRIYSTQATVYAARGELDDALASCDVALSLASASGDRLGISNASTMWTVYAFALGRFEEAAAMAVTAVGASADLGGSVRMNTLAAIAWRFALAGGDTAMAREWLNEAISLLDDEARVEPFGRDVQHSLGEVCRLDHDLEQAETWLQRALVTSPAEDALDRVARESLARVSIECGDYAKARGYLLNVLVALTRDGPAADLASCFDAIARLAWVEAADHRVAARLTAAADALYATTSAGRAPVYGAERDETAAACEASLGPEEFELAVTDGGALALSDAVDLARSVLDL